MKLPVFALCAVLACAPATADVWQPSAGHVQIPIWPGTVPDAQPAPGPEKVVPVEHVVGGRSWSAIFNVTQPTLTLYPPSGKSTGAAVVVLPGGGFEVLAIDLEGSEVCDWLRSRGITCILLKYRVPSEPYDWKCKCRPDDLATSTRSLEDLQRT